MTLFCTKPAEKVVAGVALFCTKNRRQDVEWVPKTPRKDVLVNLMEPDNRKKVPCFVVLNAIWDSDYRNHCPVVVLQNQMGGVTDPVLY